MKTFGAYKEDDELTPESEIASRPVKPNDNDVPNVRDMIRKAIEERRSGDFAGNLALAVQPFSRGMNAPDASSTKDLVSGIRKGGQEDAELLLTAEKQAQAVKDAIAKRQLDQQKMLTESEDRRLMRQQNFELQKGNQELRKMLASGAKKEKDEKKAAEKVEMEASYNVPGYERDPSILPQKTEVKELRSAVGATEDLLGKVKRLKDYVNEYGSFEYGGAGGAKMKSLARDIQLAAKNEDAYKLGVLTGPDMLLLEDIIADPSSLNSLTTRDSTRQAQLDEFISNIDSKLKNVAAAKGYKKQGLSTGIQVGQIEDGYKYVGGDPSKPESWEKQ